MKKEENKQKATAVIKILSAFDYIGAILCVLSGLLCILGGSIIVSLIPPLGFLGSELFILVGAILIILGILEFFLARGLWHLRKWAKILTFLFSVFGAIASGWLIFLGQTNNGAISLFFNLLIVLYFLASKKVAVFG